MQERRVRGGDVLSSTLGIIDRTKEKTSIM